jgi:hypothetical protein
LPQNTQRGRGVDATDTIPLEQLLNGHLAEAFRLAGYRRHRPEIEKPISGDIISELEHLGIIPPELVMHAITEPHPFLLQLFGEARPFTQLDQARISKLHTAIQMPIGAQPVGRNVGVAPIVFGTRNTEAVAQTVELLGIDGVDDEAPIQQSINDGPVRHLDCDRDNARAAGDREDPIT